uniref:Ig-like domain-containing protein n=1 Tax=Sinocyclocheilus grahami TaxID=75366 RepID=A0A672KBI6_SINGR
MRSSEKPVSKCTVLVFVVYLIDKQTPVFSVPPDVHMFARKSSDESKMKLTCLATGFYAKDVTMTIRKHCTSLPEDEVESTGIRPNHDGTFQLRKSVEINEDGKAEYDCFVSHRNFKSIIIKVGR